MLFFSVCGYLRVPQWLRRVAVSWATWALFLQGADTLSPPGPICFRATRNQQKNHRPKYFISFEMYFISFCILFYSFLILQVTAILAKCDVLFLQLWFCSVTSQCIFEAIHWSHPSHRAKTKLLWKFGVSIRGIGEDILKFSLVTLRLHCPCWKPTTYHRFVDILSRYALLWWLVPEKIAFCLQHSGTKYRYFIWAKRSTALRTAMVHSARSIALLLASFDVVLPSEREKPSWIDWKIEISPSMRWG